MTTHHFNTQVPRSGRRWLRRAGALAACLTLGLSLLAAQPSLAAPGGHGAHRGANHGGAGMDAGHEGRSQDGRHSQHMTQHMSQRMLQRTLQAVNATPEQRSAVKQIVDTAKPDLQAQRATMRGLRQQQQALFAQPNVDARAAETLRQQGLAQHDQISRRMLQLRLDIAAVLTPEQRATLAQKQSQRRAMQERHRSEREALDGQRR